MESAMAVLPSQHRTHPGMKKLAANESRKDNTALGCQCVTLPYENWPIAKQRSRRVPQLLSSQCTPSRWPRGLFSEELFFSVIV